MSYVNKHTLSQSVPLRSRILSCIADVAADATQETGKPPAWAEKRLTLAHLVLRDPEAMVPRFLWPVLTAPTVETKGEDVTDAEIKARVVLVWDTVAGVVPADKTAPTG